MRHGETTANVAGVWQGWSNAGFSARGREQVKRLSDRLRSAPYDLVISSDLGRAMATAGALGVDVESDKRWRELNLGEWEGKTQDEIHELDPNIARSLENREDVAFGGGERMSDLIGRVSEAFNDLIGRLDDGQRALVVSHGGAIYGLTSALLGTDTRGKLVRLTNTSLTTWNVNDIGPTDGSLQRRDPPSRVTGARRIGRHPRVSDPARRDRVEREPPVARPPGRRADPRRP